MDYVKLELETGENIGFEVFPNRNYSERERTVAAHRGDRGTISGYKVEDFFNTVSKFSQSLGGKIRESGASEIEVEFGISFDIGTGDLLSMVVNGSSEASIKVKLTWKKDKAKDETEEEG